MVGRHCEAGDILVRHACRIEAEIERLQVHLVYLEAKSALWDARDRSDVADEAEAHLRLESIMPAFEASVR